jgi:hypothetical protein
MDVKHRMLKILTKSIRLVKVLNCVPLIAVYNLKR